MAYDSQLYLIKVTASDHTLVSALVCVANWHSQVVWYICEIDNILRLFYFPILMMWYNLINNSYITIHKCNPHFCAIKCATNKHVIRIVKYTYTIDSLLFQEIELFEAFWSNYLSVINILVYIKAKFCYTNKDEWYVWKQTIIIFNDLWTCFL